MLDLLFSLHAERGLTMVIATHDAMVAERCERVVELVDGQLERDCRKGR